MIAKNRKQHAISCKIKALAIKLYAWIKNMKLKLSTLSKLRFPHSQVPINWCCPKKRKTVDKNKTLAQI